jgi:exodeoxyribonuclease V alpha subunit
VSPGRDATAAALEAWVRLGWLRELDRSFARFVVEQGPPSDGTDDGDAPLLELAAALASHQLGRGHPGLDLGAVLDDPAGTLALPPPDENTRPRRAAASPTPPAPGTLLQGLEAARWCAALRRSPAVGDGEGTTPLVLAGTRLSLRRYWQHGRTVEGAIDARLGAEPAASPLPNLDAPAGRAALRAALDMLFPPPAVPPAAPGAALDAEPGPDWQKIACAVAARSRFAIVTGGPGTGKTTTVVRLLALLQHLALHHAQGGAGRALRIRMAAPTGKAAARLNESVARAVQALPLQALAPAGGAAALRAAIPTEVATLHRLLGARPDTRRLAHDAATPLPLDLLVIDEASMVDLELMARTCAALRPGARLVLLGDKDQLASVEAGAVLGGLCARADAGHHTPALRDWLLDVTGQRVPDGLVRADGTARDQAIVQLRRSHRFDPAGGIGRLAEAVNRGDAAAARALLGARLPDLLHLELPARGDALRRLVLDGACGDFPGQGRGRTDRGRAVAPPVGYRHYLQRMREAAPAPGAAPGELDAWALQVLQALGAFQLLCGLRRGEAGVETLNERVAQLLQREGLIATAQGWYPGRPVMLARNDHALGLMNGDVGVALARDGGLRVAFPAGDGRGGVRWVLPSRLQAVETAYAMTVHKSQGSEFAHAALLLPAHPSPVLTRELLYTAITRASHWFTLAVAEGGAGVLESAVGRRVRGP